MPTPSVIFVQVSTPSPPATPSDQIPAPCASPSGILCFYRVPRTLIVLTLAQDPATGAAISLEIANRFNRPGNQFLKEGSAVFQAAPYGWGLTDLANACSGAPSTNSSGKLALSIVGALVVYSASTQVNSYNYALFTRSETRIDAQAQFVRCTVLPEAGNAIVAQPVGPLFDDLIGTGPGLSLSLGPGAAVVSGLNALSSAKQTTNVMTYMIPTAPPSGRPIPNATGYQTMYTTQQSQNYDTGALLANSVVGQLNSQNSFIFPGNNAPAQLKNAAQHIADDLFSRVERCPAVVTTTDIQDLLNVDFSAPKPVVVRSADPNKRSEIC